MVAEAQQKIFCVTEWHRESGLERCDGAPTMLVGKDITADEKFKILPLLDDESFLGGSHLRRRTRLMKNNRLIGKQDFVASLDR